MLTYVGDALNAFFFAHDGVCIRGIVILLNFAFEDAMCRAEFVDFFVYQAQAFLFVLWIIVPQKF
jgi:hypothetical protein